MHMDRSAELLLVLNLSDHEDSCRDFQHFIDGFQNCWTVLNPIDKISSVPMVLSVTFFFRSWKTDLFGSHTMHRKDFTSTSVVYTPDVASFLLGP